jgi:hypothetical protein
MSNEGPEPQEKVGFRDIYRAVGESETRIKEHISLVLLPLTSTLADHEKRLRIIEEEGSDEARLALARATAVELRVTAVEAWKNDLISAGLERRRLGGLTNKALAAIVLSTNFILGLIIMFANLLTDHSH